jgi:hypothetical protein
MGTIPPAYVRVACRAGTRQPYSFSVPSPHRLFKISSTVFWETQRGGGVGMCEREHKCKHVNMIYLSSFPPPSPNTQSYRAYIDFVYQYKEQVSTGIYSKSKSFTHVKWYSRSTLQSKVVIPQEAPRPKACTCTYIVQCTILHSRSAD